MTLPENINKILKYFSAFSTYIYGNAVREILSGSTPSVCRIAINASPAELQRMFPKHQFSHGSLTVIIENTECRIIPFNDDIREICRHSDFTVNSLAYSPVTGICDITNGVQDIENHIIRFADNSEAVLYENPILMLRAIRLSAELNSVISINSEKLIQHNCAMIRYADKRAIMHELTKIIMSSHPDDIRELHRLGLLRYIMPPLNKCFGEPQKNRYHIYDVGEHIMATVKSTPKDYVLRWAALLHDVGKPNCSSTDSNGIIHFYGHHRESRCIADDILHSYRMNPEHIKNVLTLIENHDVRIEPTYIAVKRMMARTGSELFDKLLILQTADNMAKNPQMFAEKYRRINAARNIYNSILENNEPYEQSQLMVNQNDLQKLGFRTGRDINDTMKMLMEAVIHDKTLNRRDYLLCRAKQFRRN